MSSINRSEWIQTLITIYKKNLNERKLNLDDDYIKFIRYGQYFIDNNLSGILAYISNNSFIDGITHREMRKSLLESFDEIYILDLHGNSNKKETNVDGSPDANVFDIQQGVSINIFIKTGKKQDNELAKVYHSEIFGKREVKYQYLQKILFSDICWKELSLNAPYYFFVPKDFSNQLDYRKGFSILEIFPLTSPGIKTERDGLTIHFSENHLKETIDYFKNHDIHGIREFYHLKGDSRDWKIEWAKKDLMSNNSADMTKIILYRPFDYRHTFYTGKSKGFMGTPAYKASKHLLNNDNIALISSKQCKNDFGVFVTNHIAIHKACVAYDINFISPLYIYPDDDFLAKDEKRRPNLNPSIIQEIAGKTGLAFTEEKDNTENAFAPIDLLDYIYAVLYSNNYRAKYREFLKIDFPRIPYPENAEQFQKLVFIGSLLRNLHLMENVSPAMDTADFPVAGTNEIEAVNYKAEKVYVNKHQYFENISPEIWGYYIGGYQPAEKWLKDRKGRVLSFDDIEHYQKIISVLKMTIELQAQLDEIIK